LSADEKLSETLLDETDMGAKKKAGNLEWRAG